MSMSSYHVGDVVLFGNRVGIVRYYGKLLHDPKNDNNVYAGIETFMTNCDYGNCDGTFDNVRYFNCAPNHGIFVDAKEIICSIDKQELLGKLGSQQQHSEQTETENKHNDNSIYQTFTSKTLAWYYNRWNNEWDIVYKMEISEENSNFWIVKDYNGKNYVANKHDLHDTPPSSKLTITQVFSLLKDRLAKLFENTVVHKSQNTNANTFDNDDPFNAPWLQKMKNEKDNTNDDFNGSLEKKQESQQSHSPAVESRQTVGIEKLCSKSLGWYYNQLSKQWDIVFKIKVLKEKTNVWVVKDCNGKQSVVNKERLYDLPPSGQLSLKQIISITMKILSQLMRQVNVSSNESESKQLESPETTVVSSSIETMLNEAEKIINEIKKQHEKQNSDSSKAVSLLLQQVNDANSELQEKINEMNKLFSSSVTTTMDSIDNPTHNDVNSVAIGSLTDVLAVNTYNYANNQYAPSIASGVTDVTKVTGGTGITGVSSIAPPLSMNDPLIVMMGIGEYDGMRNLDGIARDYDNIIDTFVKYWKYKIFYRLNDNTFVYTNNKDEIKTNYKLKWDSNQIDEFIEESRKYLVRNRHNGLIFAISSHGDTGKVLYDSECEKYYLDGVFSMYSPQASVLLESYQETEEETNHLFSIPKIFFLDMCRGDGKAKVTKVEQTDKKDENDNEAEIAEVTTPSYQQKINEEENKTQITEAQEISHKTSLSLHKNVYGAQQEKLETTETFQTKGISKEEAHTLVAQMANFAKIYANIEGFSVGDGSLHGGIFLRNVCKVFKDVKFVSSHKFTDMVFKIREYTKREATLNGKLFNFTQIVENEGTLEREVVFGSKYANIVSQSLIFDSNLSTLGETQNYSDFSQEDDQVSQKLCISNVSRMNPVAVLVEMEQNRENRREMLKTLEKQIEDDNHNAFVDNGFVIIGKNYDSHEFIKVWDEYYVTIFVLSKEEKRNRLICDRRVYFSDFLYFKNNKLYALNDDETLPKCNYVADESHSMQARVKQPSSSQSNNIKCRLCLESINATNKTIVECTECKKSLCQDCCHSLVMNKVPPRMKESTYFKFNIANLFRTNKIAVLVSVYASFSKARQEITERYENYDESEFLAKGFVVIGSNGAQHTFNTVWQSVYVVAVKISNKGDKRNKLLYNGYKDFDASKLYCIGVINYGKFIFTDKDKIVPKCNNVPTKQHSLDNINVNGGNGTRLVMCKLCSSSINGQRYCYYCKECKHFLCHKCIDSIIFDKIEENIKKSSVTVYNASKKFKLAVLLDVDYQYYDKQKNERLIDLFKSDQSFIKQGFTIINPGEKALVNTIWNSYRATIAKFQEKTATVVCNMMHANTTHLRFVNDQVYPVVNECNAIENKRHDLQYILVNKEIINENSNLDTCMFCSSEFQVGSQCYYCRECKHSLCQQCLDLIILNKTPLKWYIPLVVSHVQPRGKALVEKKAKASVEQKTKSSLEIALKTVQPPSQQLEYKMETEITNGNTTVQSSVSIDWSNAIVTNKNSYTITMPLNVDELEKEFKESQLNCNVKLRIIDTKYKLESWFDPATKNIPIWIRIGLDYSCTFTTLNGNGRFGPTNMDEYKGQCHFNDTKLDNEQKGMQLWTIPKTGKYKVTCYGAKGGDSRYNGKYFFERHRRSLGGKGAKVGSILKLFKNDIVKIACGQKGSDYNGNSSYGAGGGGGTYFILYKIGNKNPNYDENEIVNIPLIIAAGGHGAGEADSYELPGIDGLCDTSENRNNYGGYKLKGRAGRGASFKNDFDTFKTFGYNECNPMSFFNGAIGGKGYDEYSCDGGFGGGGGGYFEGGGGGGYIGGPVPRQARYNQDPNKYFSYGALSYICENNNIDNNTITMKSGANNGNGKIEIMYASVRSRFTVSEWK